MGNPNDKFLFNSKECDFRGEPSTLQPYLVIPILMSRSLDKAIVERIEFNKGVNSPEHEFLLCHLIEKCDDSKQTPRRSYVVVERRKAAESDKENPATAPTPGPTPPSTPPTPKSYKTPSTTDIPSTVPTTPSKTSKGGVPQSVAKTSKLTIHSSSNVGAISEAISNSSGRRPASDVFQFTNDGTLDFLEPWRNFDTIEFLDLRKVKTPFTLAMLATLARVIHDQAVDYTVIPNQCYWFSACIYRFVSSYTGVKTSIKNTRRPTGTSRQGMIRVPILMGTNGRKPSSPEWLPLFEEAWAEDAEQIHEYNKKTISQEESLRMIKAAEQKAEDERKGREAADQKAEDERKGREEITQRYAALERAYELERNKNKNFGLSIGNSYNQVMSRRPLTGLKTSSWTWANINGFEGLTSSKA
ncbi:hypothetical protein BU17DRAFT_72101 [Hysterangium stoloniferum]|nr:hypothetical protein BU17DRAFT_72101 [Hysterangium stoloniferum]